VCWLFVLFVASPCTEPFSICSTSVLLSAPATHAAALPSRVPIVAAVSHDDTGYPPLSLTDDQLKDAKDVIAPQAWGAAAPRPVPRPVVIASLIVPGASPVAPVVLRL